MVDLSFDPNAGFQANLERLDPSMAHLAGGRPAMYRPTGGEWDSLALLGRENRRAAQQRQGLNEFYSDPQRQVEIDRAVQPGTDAAFMQLADSIRQRRRQEAFSRARTGNIGGSVQASQQAAVQAANRAGGLRIGAQDQSQRMGLAEALRAQQVQELINTYQIDPTILAAIQQRVASTGVAGETNAALEAIRQNTNRDNAFAADEMSRALGNIVNVGSQQYQMYQQNQTLNQLAEIMRRYGLAQPQGAR